MTYVLRVPDLTDAPEIAELHVSTWRETYGRLLPDDFFDEEHLAGRQRMWNHILTRRPEGLRVWIAETAGRIVGFGLAGPSYGAGGAALPRELQLFALYLASDLHGSGAGQELLEAVLGDDPSMLWVARENPRAIGFYRRNGFEFDGVEQADPAAPKITDARMVR
ncbi:GNAT family N-acetyltransferase [Zhihengliuella halotolerans]|uniref:Ribosomal protein S18 acetylase RimI-like enzyme n=1 Tax=Zhihengliuella halotolerans TaxID=370736 RepID=A0A4Q8AIF1_9MICC|nr:GNAT family N-acetyltransferase [Zhihengliuella halotolerans]RZU63593.1 ribosomal protein S18 acetylase RimI-like enzyme [Zhihengliuella halotolerans]